MKTHLRGVERRGEIRSLFLGPGILMAYSSIGHINKMKTINTTQSEPFLNLVS